MLSIKNVSKIFPDKNIKALDRVNLKIEKGEHVALIGPNGAGKSTLLKIILDVISSSEGEITVSVPQNKISFISVEMSLYDEMTVFDYLQFFAEIYEVTDIKQKIGDFAEKLNFQEHLNHKIHGLSTGNKQKILMTRALINEPELLILDEPTNGLDVIISYEIRKLIAELQEKGATTIICSHLVEDLKLSDRVVMIDQGKIIEDKENTGDIDIYHYFIGGGVS